MGVPPQDRRADGDGGGNGPASGADVKIEPGSCNHKGGLKQVSETWHRKGNEFLTTFNIQFDI